MKATCDGRSLLTTGALVLRLDGAPARPLGGRLFRKEVLRAGQWVHPADDRPIEFTVTDLEEIAAETNRYIGALGGRLRFPDGHDAADPKAANNLGYWLSFGVEGERLYGVVEAADDEIAKLLGGRIRDVSIYLEPEAKDSHGNTFRRVLTHVAATPVPVIEGQTNFIQLSRSGATEAGRIPVLRLASIGEGRKQMSMLKGIAADLGLGSDDMDDTALEAEIRKKLKAMRDEKESATAASAQATQALSAKSGEVTALASRVAELEKDLDARDQADCDREVREVKDLAAKHGRPDALGAERERFIRDRWRKDKEAARQTLGLAREIATAAPTTGGTVVVKPVDKVAQALARKDAVETAKREARAMGWNTRETADGKLLATKPGETREIVLVG